MQSKSVQWKLKSNVVQHSEVASTVSINFTTIQDIHIWLLCFQLNSNTRFTDKIRL